MPEKDTITFAIGGGDLSIERFAVAVRRFVDLVHAINAELSNGAEIDWVLADLEYGSASATARAVIHREEDRETAERMIDAYLSVGVALDTAQPIPFPGRVERNAIRVKQLLDAPPRNGEIPWIRFETIKDDVTIEASPEPHPLPREAWGYSYGAVEGRIQAISSRGTLRFTLYDLLHDGAVSCYLDESLTAAEREQIMRDVWGRIAAVEGYLKRDHRTGRPRTVRRIRKITVLPEPNILRYQDARGAWPISPGGLSPEDAINRIRDVG